MDERSQSTLTEIEKAMQWERMSGERLSDVERARIEAGGEFHPPGCEDQPAKNLSTVAPGEPRVGCPFCDGLGVVSQSSYDRAVSDGLERIAWKPGVRCMCTYTWAEIAPSVADICAEVANHDE